MMFAAFLSLILAAAPADDVAVAIAIAKAHRERPKVVKLSYPAGYHEHECPYDHARWGHGGSSKGKVADHTCPTCGRVIWDKVGGVQLQPGEVRTPKTHAKMTTYCPT